MSIKTMQKITFILLFLFISGCAGYNRALLMTKTNVGLDIDNTPPTAEITIARREIAIQPIFPVYPNPDSNPGNPDSSTPSIPEGAASAGDSKKDSDREYALPLVAAFAKLDGFFNLTISAYFAGGDAAIHIVQENNADPSTSNPSSLASTASDSGSSLCLQNEPLDMRSPLKKIWDSILFKNPEAAKKAARAESRPFYFATDTSTGLKVAWSGTGGPYPDSLKFGYNRKEFASPPVFVNNIKEGCNGNSDYQWQIKLPSFVATVNAGADISSSPDKSSMKQTQFFATGKAATEFAKRKDVKALIEKHITTFGSTPTAEPIK